MTIEAKYAIQVLAALINDTTTPMPPAQIDWKAFFDFALIHKVENMVYAALLCIEDKVPTDVMAMLAQRYSFAIAHEAAQEISFEELMAKFEEEQIKSIPLKGCILKHLYPMPDYRQSGDIDILIAEEDYKKVAPIMKKLGYAEDQQIELEHHLGYRRPPNVLVEIHKMLIESGKRGSDFFGQVWEHTHLAEGYNHCYEMDKEMLYAYIVAHMAKHVKNTGAGIRLVLDIWVLLKLWEDEFNQEKLTKALEGADLTQFNEWAVALAKMWFGGEKCGDKNVLALGEYVVDSGIYGNIKNRKKIEASTVGDSKMLRSYHKVKRFFRYIFVPVITMRYEYPIVMKYKFLLPALWVVRAFKLLLSKDIKPWDRIKKSVCIDDDAQELKEIWESVR